MPSNRGKSKTKMWKYNSTVKLMILKLCILPCRHFTELHILGRRLPRKFSAKRLRNNFMSG